MIARYTHPDKTADAGSQDLYIKIHKAYEVLSNKVSRAIYDHYGFTGLDVLENEPDQFEEYSDIINDSSNTEA